MATESPASPENAPSPVPKTVRIHRFQIGLNVLVQVLILFVIVVMANYLSFRHYRRWDYSRNQKYKLSSQTTNILTHLKKPVRAVVFFSTAADIAPDLQGLMREYEFASKKKFTVEYVDPYRNLARAQELQTKYKFGKDENILILDFDGRSKFVNAVDMGEFEMPDQMAMLSGQTQAKLKAFKGEQAVTSALLELTEGKPNKVYLLAGHGETALADQDLKLFNEAMKRQNIQVAPLKLLDVGSIPEDARAVIIYGPKYDLSELEVKQLSTFWEKKGRVFAFLNPFARTPRFTAWLTDQGVVPLDDRVVGLKQFGTRDENGDIKIVKGLVRDAGFIVVDSRTKITKDFEGLNKRLLGTTQSLDVNKAAVATGKLKTFPIMESEPGFWGETDLTGDDDQASFDPKKGDLMGPLPLAIGVEKGGVDDERVKVETSRLVVVGNAQMLGGEAYRMSDTVSLGLSINALNWLLDREEVIGIPPKAKDDTLFSLEDKQVAWFSIAVMGIIPLTVVLFGLIVWLLRRN